MAAFDIDDIDAVIHGRIRLGIMAYLAQSDVADFNELKQALKATQGNLSIHLTKLEEAGYVTIEKGFVGRKPRTRIRVTPAGRKALARYLQGISQLLEHTQKTEGK
jgi:DNA-binding MarR family transcriptional regulator